jgi:hypothetical protein
MAGVRDQAKGSPDRLDTNAGPTLQQVIQWARAMPALARAGEREMGAADSHDGDTFADGPPAPEPAAGTRESGGRDLPALPTVTPGPATIDPAGPAALGRPVDSATVAEASAPPNSREPPLPAIDGYEIMGELGRGAMGVVYRARHVLLNRPCVLKMILAGEHAGAQAVARFLAEAEAVARLQHPNVVQIHHVGEATGLPFFELEYVEGGSLDRRLDGTPWPPRRAAELVEALARGVAEAHRLGIVHRDLKPGNVLLADPSPPTPLPEAAESYPRGISMRRW